MTTESKSLSGVNARIQRGETLTNTEKGELWGTWLWKTDPCSKYITQIGFNEHHLIGLIIARDAANLGFLESEPFSADHIDNLPDIFSVRCLEPFCDLPMTMIMDTVDCLQCSWAKHLYDAPCKEVWWATELFVNMLFKRVGKLIGSTDVDDRVFNHIATTEVRSDGRVGLTQSAVRQLLDIFFVLFRHIDLYKRSREVRVAEEDHGVFEEGNLKLFTNAALEATRDDFYKLTTFYDLPVGSRLSYMHRFSGMYNCVSQVAYFHNEGYTRRVPPKTMCALHSAIDELAVLAHMHPDVPVVFEDERIKHKGPFWMLLPGRIYLVNANGVILCNALASVMFYACGSSLDEECSVEDMVSSSVGVSEQISL